MKFGGREKYGTLRLLRQVRIAKLSFNGDKPPQSHNLEMIVIIRGRSLRTAL
jgi:hypothetical protein